MMARRYKVVMLYEDVELIGEGGMGQVWKALDRRNNRFVARKYLKNLAADDRKRFEIEAKNLGQSRGVENIVQIIDCHLNCQYPYIITEYCEGGSLAAKIGTFDHIHATNVLSGMVRALKFIHSKNGIHRDIKPPNILLALRNNLWVSKLSDFGLACNPQAGSQMTQTAIGTREYFAPEILRGELFTQSADIYSLGLTIRELITGSREPTINALIIPFRLSALLGEMMAPQPQGRPNIFQVERRVTQIIESRNNFIDNLVSSVSPRDIGLGLLVGLALSAVGSSKK